MAQLSKFSGQYLMSQYAFSRMMDVADERFFPITDETMEQVRSSMLDTLGDGSEAVFCRQNLLDEKTHGSFTDAFLDGLKVVYAAEPDVLQELFDEKFRDELVRKCCESCARFVQGTYNDKMVILANTGMPRQEIERSGAFANVLSRETVAVDLEDLNEFFPDKTLIRNVGGYRNGDGKARSGKPEQMDFWQAVSKCPLYHVDETSQRIDRDTIAAKSSTESKSRRFSLGTRPGIRSLDDILAEKAAEKAAMLEMAANLEPEPDLPDRYYIAMYGKWKNDPFKIPVPNTRTGCFIEPHNLKLSELAGQCWCAQHAFGRMMDMAEQYVYGNNESKFKEKFTVAVRNSVIAKLGEKGRKFDELYLCRADCDNDCDLYADTVADVMAEHGFTQDKYPNLRAKLGRGIDMGYYEFAREFIEPMYRRPFMILNTRGLPDGYKRQVPSFHGYRAVVGVYLDEIADRFPDAKKVYSPLEGRTPEDAVEFTTMLSHTPAYELRRLKGRRYITQEPVFEGSPPGPVQLPKGPISGSTRPVGVPDLSEVPAQSDVPKKVGVPKAHDVSDLDIDPDYGDDWAQLNFAALL